MLQPIRLLRFTLESIARVDSNNARWEALLFYVYSGKIAFAPLRSEGAEERMLAMKQHKHDHPHQPPLVSPKSVYRLADKVIPQSERTLYWIRSFY